MLFEILLPIMHCTRSFRYRIKPSRQLWVTSCLPKCVAATETEDALGDVREERRQLREELKQAQAHIAELEAARDSGNGLDGLAEMLEGPLQELHAEGKKNTTTMSPPAVATIAATLERLLFAWGVIPETKRIAARRKRIEREVIKTGATPEDAAAFAERKLCERTLPAGMRGRREADDDDDDESEVDSTSVTVSPPLASAVPVVKRMPAAAQKTNGADPGAAAKPQVIDMHTIALEMFGRPISELGNKDKGRVMMEVLTRSKAAKKAAEEAETKRLADAVKNAHPDHGDVGGAQVMAAAQALKARRTGIRDRERERAQMVAKAAARSAAAQKAAETRRRKKEAKASPSIETGAE